MPPSATGHDQATSLSERLASEDGRKGTYEGRLGGWKKSWVEEGMLVGRVKWCVGKERVGWRGEEVVAKRTDGKEGIE